MSDFDFVRYLLAPALAGRNILDPIVQADLVQVGTTGTRLRVRFECVAEGVLIAGGRYPRTIRWEDLEQLESPKEILDLMETQ